mgnify:CR=1 FL=1
MFKGIKEKFSTLVEKHITGTGDGADVITREDLYSPEVLSLSETFMVHPTTIRRHQDFCKEIGIELHSRKQVAESLRAFLALKHD